MICCLEELAYPLLRTCLICWSLFVGFCLLPIVCCFTVYLSVAYRFLFVCGFLLDCELMFHWSLSGYSRLVCVCVCVDGLIIVLFSVDVCLLFAVCELLVAGIYWVECQDERLRAPLPVHGDLQSHPPLQSLLLPVSECWFSASSVEGNARCLRMMCGESHVLPHPPLQVSLSLLPFQELCCSDALIHRFVVCCPMQTATKR